MANPFLSLVSKYGDGAIIIFGVALTIVLIRYTLALSKKGDRISELVNRSNKKYKKNKETHEIEEEDDTDSAVTPDTVRKHEKEFNLLCSKCGVCSQLIPLFPLLGILGTVAGLMLEVEAQDISALMDSLSTAMSTTLSGLFWAIVLKIIDIFPSKIMSDTEVQLEDYYKKRDLAE